MKTPTTLSSTTGTTLPLDKAVNLVLSICPRIGESAPRLVELCDGYIYALRLCTGLLADDEYISVESYIQALQEERTYLEQFPAANAPAPAIQAVLNTSYEALPHHHQTLLCQLSVFCTSFDLSAAMAVMSSDPGLKKKKPSSLFAYERVLDLFYRRNLLKWDKRVQRYSMVNVVRSFAAHHLEYMDETYLRYARHYLGVAQKASDLYQNDNDEHHLAGRTLFEQEQAHIDTCLSWLHRQNPSPVIDQLLADYVVALHPISGSWYDHSCRIAQLHAAIEAAVRLDNPSVEAHLLDNLGAVYEETGQVRLAIACYERRLKQPSTKHRIAQRPWFWNRSHLASSTPSREVATRTPWRTWFSLFLMASAELLLLAGFYHIGLAIHAIFLVGGYSYAVSGRLDAERKLTLALTLIPLSRLLSYGFMLFPLELATPFLPSLRQAVFLVWDLAHSLLLFIGVSVAIWNLGISRRELGLSSFNPILSTAFIVTVVGLGVLGYIALVVGSLRSAHASEMVWLFLILIPAFSGATEELLFRGVIHTMIQPCLGEWSPLYVSLLFASVQIQYGSLQVVAFAFLAGLLLSYIVLWSRSLLLAMVLHSLFNVLLFFLLPTLGDLTVGSVRLIEVVSRNMETMPTGSLSLIPLLTLFALLVQKEIFNSLRSIRSRNINHALDSSLYPVFLLSAGIVLLTIVRNVLTSS